MAGDGNEEVDGARFHGALKSMEPLALASPAGLEPMQARVWRELRGVEAPLLLYLGALCPQAARPFGLESGGSSVHFYLFLFWEQDLCCGVLSHWPLTPFLDMTFLGYSGTSVPS